MKENNELINYIHAQRWCGFKQDIADGNVVGIEFEYIPFDNGNKLFNLGKAKLADGSEKVFFMPLAKGHLDGTECVVINGQEMFDAMKAPDYWSSLMQMFKENNNQIKFSNGTEVIYHNIGYKQVIDENINAVSKPLNVEQSNTTIKVGDNAIAFKQDRMIESDYGVSTELEMNAKLMEAKCSAMPKTFGAIIMKEPNGKVATLGIAQEFIPNKGDLWEFANKYLVNALNQAYANGQKVIDVNEHADFVKMMENLGQKADEMSASLAKPNGNPAFEPEAIDEKYLHIYGKNLEVLLHKTKMTIQQNLENLDAGTQKQTLNLLNNWDNLTKAFLEQNMQKIAESPDRHNIVRVHGDFHLGQVLVKSNNDLTFLDFAGEPGLPSKERKAKYPETRDFAGMYRSINGYLGAVAAETFAATGETVTRTNGSSRSITNPEQEAWAKQAIAPMIQASVKAFMQGKNEQEPLLALEILRKNLYEVQYEVSNRPDMAQVPVKDLIKLLNNTNSETRSHKQTIDESYAAIKNSTANKYNR